LSQAAYIVVFTLQELMNAFKIFNLPFDKGSKFSSYIPFRRKCGNGSGCSSTAWLQDYPIF